VADPLAIWGAVTGTAGLGIALRREVISNRRGVRVDHGWRYALKDDDPPQLFDMRIYVMVTNIGRRDIAVEHVGWEWLVPAGTDDAGRNIYDAHRAELPLAEPVLLKPDGAPAKFETSVGQLLALGIDALADEVWPVAFTDGGNVGWHGEAGLLAQKIPPRLGEERLRAGLARLRDETVPPRVMGRDGLYALRPDWAPGLEGLSGP
jgi:hypothetical protein